MADLKLSHVYKVYPNGAKAVSDFSLDIKDGEFIVFVGPSGCGKSTTLRMIAGLEEITAGDLFIGDKLMNYEEPKDRDIAFVFQNYALYPHMTIYENMAFGLKNQKITDTKKDKNGNEIIGIDKKKISRLKRQLMLAKVKKDEQDVLRLEMLIDEAEKNPGPIEIRRHYTKSEIDEKIKNSSHILGITDYLARKPKEMSGGQRQRVALGRALVRDPKAFLLDEPLSNLDAKLRGQMRTEITKLHQEVKKTFIYVTHDQVEAMTMGDRIVVMKDGFIQQIDTPMNLYDHPRNKFVAGFIGTPQMNFFPVTLKKDGEEIEIHINDASFRVSYSLLDSLPASYLNGDKEITLGIRSEHIDIVSDGIPFKVSVVEKLGDETLVYGDIVLKDTTYPCTIKTSGNHNYQIGQMLAVQFKGEKIHLFDEKEESLLPSVRDSYEIKAKVEQGELVLFQNRVKLPSSLSMLDKMSDVVIMIPNDAFVKGDTFTFDKKEGKLVDGVSYFRIDDEGYHYYFKEGENAPSYDLDFTKLTFIQDGKAVIQPVSDTLTMTGKIIKGKKNEYFFSFHSKEVPAMMDAVRKAALVDGYDCHKKEYDFIVPIDAIKIDDNGTFHGEIVDILDYGKAKYIKVKWEEDLIYIPYINKDEKIGTTISFNIDFSTMSLYRKEDQVRIY